MAVVFFSAFDQGRRNAFTTSVILHFFCLILLFSGITLVSISPSLFKGNPRIRSICLFYGLFCGIGLLVCGVQLEVTDRLLERIKKVEDEIALSQFAAEQYAQQQYYEQLAEEANPELPPTSAPYFPPTSAPTSEALTVGSQGVQDLGSVSGSGSKAAEVGSAIAQLASIKSAYSQGKSDTWIIEEILGFKGRNFERGKEILVQYKEAIG